MSPHDLSRLQIDRSPPARALGGWLAFGLLLIAILGYLGRAALGPSTGAITVRLGRVERSGGGEPRSGISANGHVVARQRAALSTVITGRPVELAVEEGDRVLEAAVIGGPGG